VVSTRQLKALGYTRQAASKANGIGRLKRLYRGVYAVGHEALTPEGHCMAAILACRPCVASHWTAAWVWGLLRSSPSTYHVTAPSTRHRRRGFVIHSAALGDEDVTKREGIPVTSLARTHLDIAAVAPERIPRMLERSEVLKLFDLRSFEALLGRSAHHPGHRPLQQALRVYRPDPTVLRSNLERRFRDLVCASSLPRPGHNVVVGPYELDCYWPDHGFCVELDVFATHGSRRSFETDREREDDLLLMGIEVMRVTDVRLEREPRQVLDRVAAHLERRGSRPVD
jgi:very-short-patch-repair endonuclease